MPTVSNFGKKVGRNVLFVMLRWLLAPLAWLYHLATAMRNYLYDSGYFASHEFDRLVIAVGNLNVGGSGKTPMVEYLIGQLSSKHRVATLSRGYGRKSKGFRRVTATETAMTVGDEPLQMFQKFGNQVSVFVGEDRALAIPAMLAEEPEIEIILLDDAFQHRSVRPQFSILVTDSRTPFCYDFILPLGRLREARRGAARADVIVVTKCEENYSAEWRERTVGAVQDVAGRKPVLFAGLRYRNPVGFQNQAWVEQPVVLVTGIANYKPFVEHVVQRFQLVTHFHFPDHHAFSRPDIDKIVAACRKGSGAIALLTTEKDYTRLQEFSCTNCFEGVRCFYIPIEMKFLEQDGKVFDGLLHGRVQERLS